MTGLWPEGLVTSSSRTAPGRSLPAQAPQDGQGAAISPASHGLHLGVIATHPAGGGGRGRGVGSSGTGSVGAGLRAGGREPGGPTCCRCPQLVPRGSGRRRRGLVSASFRGRVRISPGAGVQSRPTSHDPVFRRRTEGTGPRPRATPCGVTSRGVRTLIWLKSKCQERLHSSALSALRI